MRSSPVSGFSPGVELEYIQACLANQLFPERSRPEPTPGLDWERLFQELVRTRLAGHFYAFRDSYHQQWPAALGESLRREHYGLLLYGDQALATVRKALSVLRQAGLDVIVLKGWALIPTIYQSDPSQRFCEDIDLLIHPRDAGRAEALLQQAGFQGLPESWPGYNRRYTNARAYIHPDQPAALGRRFAVGLHWGLWHIPVYSPAQVDLEALFARARALQVAGQPALQLGLEDGLVYACAHIWLHHRKDENLFRYYELAAVLLRAGSPPDWAAVIEQAQRWQVLLPLRNVFENIAARWADVIPPAVLEQVARLQPARRERFVDRWNGLLRDKPTFNHLLTWLSMPGWKTRLGVILEDAFPGPSYLRQRYGPAPLGLWPLLYFRRLFNAFRYLSSRIWIRS